MKESIVLCCKDRKRPCLTIHSEADDNTIDPYRSLNQFGYCSREDLVKSLSSKKNANV